MQFTTEQLGRINAAVAHLMKVYGEKSEVPNGALQKYNDGRALRFSVYHSDGFRYLSVNSGGLAIEVGRTPGPTQPNMPEGSSGDVYVELRKAA